MRTLPDGELLRLANAGGDFQVEPSLSATCCDAAGVAHTPFLEAEARRELQPELAQ